MASPSTFFLFLLFILLTFHANAGSIILEEGFTVTTVLDGHKVNVNPHSILQRSGSSDLILLDSTNSVFYTLQFPISSDSIVRRLSGDGSAGYKDGDVISAEFNKPRSFAVDLKGNVYVADKNNKAIRKISSNGVTTIVGDFSEKSSRKNGLSQNVSLSNDFELAFIPGLCALLVSDHMHQLIHQINLKEEDCTFGSNSGLGAAMIWTLGLGLSCLLGLVIGIAVGRQEGLNTCHFATTWKHCLTPLGNLVQILYSGNKSAAASNICSFLIQLWKLILSYLLLFRFILASRRPCLESVSLMDLDACNSGEVTKSSKYHDQLKELISFDEELIGSTSKRTFNNTRGKSVGILEYHGDDDVIMQANMVPTGSILHQGGVLKRRHGGL
ncbi:uncharacterized protein LOC107634713 [Arachis ipaensis]|uniref:NHL repeat-containing protein n=1 Tax=Arachis hypogaea TaxID=3818 RepID=A0A445DPH1_ARAHY|nr:uncharacterized protein LOC107634713 [Arachis ipaensis]XP_025638863.1 uncharacterized protein LOC112733942 isoform X2 [Arachis hypogaea]RYR65060.1 hypothetical protein Ahy_A03g011059 [Arachis hypogaea]